MNSIPFNIPFTHQFFSGYLVDHFLYKQFTLYNILENYKELKPSVLKDLEDICDDEYQKSLRIEIRATYFQAIETLFELVFSLEPRTSYVDNKHIWYYLSTSQWRQNYKRIEQISSGDTTFLDREIIAGKDIKVSFAQYLFYFGVTNPTMLDAVTASIDPIKKYLIAFSKEFIDRDEYNAFKHSLRIVPALQKIEIGTSGSDKTFVSLDMNNSMTYIIEEGDSISFKTKPIDTLRDMRMSLVCSYLISNIVRSRKQYFTKNGDGYLHTFNEESFPSSDIRNVNWMDFIMSFRPVKNVPNSNSDSVTS